MKRAESLREWFLKLGMGKVFRKMGLPAWTFMGVGIAAIWFNTLSGLVEKLTRDALGLDKDSPMWATYVPPVVAILIPFLAVLLAARWIPKQSVSIISYPDTPTKKKGIILLVSKAESAIFAIEHHFGGPDGRLERVWLIPSNDQQAAFFGKNSRDEAEKIQQQCARLAEVHQKKLEVVIHTDGVSPGDAQDTYDYVNRVYRRSGYEARDLIADFTGGTKPMSVGMIMACLPTERELQYVAFHPQSKVMHGPFLVDYQHTAFDLVG